MNVTSTNDPNIFEFTSLKIKNLKSDQMIADSPKVVLKALSTNQKIIKIFCTHEFFRENENILSAYQDITYKAYKSTMQEIIGHKLHHGVMALIKRPVLKSSTELSGNIIILNGLTSPENVGTIIRTAASFNVRSIIVDQKTCSPFLRRCVRVSMGNIFYVNVHLSSNLEQTLSDLKNRSYNIVSCANSKDAKELQDYSFTQKNAIIIGSEGHGIESNILKSSDHIVRINIMDDVAHINAASAASIFLYSLSL